MIKLVETDLNFPNERRAAQLANVLVLLDPLRERKTIIRWKLGGFGFEFLDVHARKIPRFIARANRKVEETIARCIKAEQPGLEALNEPDDSAGDVEELNAFFRRYPLTA